MAVLDYSTTAASNTTIDGIPCQGSSSVKNGDDLFRNIAADIAASITRVVDKSTGSHTALKADAFQMWRCTGNVTLNLTAAATLTDGWSMVVKADGGTVTIDPNSSEQINGASTLVLASGKAAKVYCTGTAFFALVFNEVLSAVALSGSASDLSSGTLPNARLPARLRELAQLNTITDADAVTETGWSLAAGTATGLPTANSFYIHSAMSTDTNPADTGTQKAYRRSNGEVYRRQKTTGVWGSWTRWYVTQAELEALLDVRYSRVGESAEVATTAGTAFDFTGIPSWVTEIEVVLNAVSLSGTDSLLVQIGPAAGIETSGYVSRTAYANPSSYSDLSSTAGFAFPVTVAARAAHGFARLRKVAADTWVYVIGHYDGSTNTGVGGGKKTMAGSPLTQLRLTRTGSNTFDAGSVKVYWRS